MRLRVLGLTCFLASPSSAAEPPVDSAAPKRRSEPVWEPGEPTTSRVEPEVDGPGEPARGGGVHGRFEGDLDLGLTAGVHADGDAVGGLLAASLHYFWIAGVAVTYVDAFGADDASAERLLSLGVDARPAFIARFAENLAQGPALLDLTLDSISLGVGAFWASPRGGVFGDRRGLETSLGFGVPLMARAPGPWLTTRGFLRFADRAGGGTDRAEAAVSLSLSWHALFSSGR